MNILFIGPNQISSKHKYLCLKKLYKNVDIINGYNSFILNQISERIFHHISSKLFENQINKYFLKNIKKNYDLIFVDSGEFIGKNLILELKKRSKKIVYYCNDNPFVDRDKQKWKLSLGSLKYYDLIVFHNKSRVAPAKKIGIKNILLVLPSYQKGIHKPLRIINKERYNNNVIFIGTWEPERGLFFQKIIKMGLKIKIYGTRWKKDRYYDSLKPYTVLGHVDDPLYSKLIYKSKIALCLPSVGNNDDITKRSIEIPAIGTLLCATRTKSHLETFEEDKEAIFFKDAKECYLKCNNLLNDIKKIERIAHQGHIKVTRVLKTDFESIIKKIVNITFNKNIV